MSPLESYLSNSSGLSCHVQNLKQTTSLADLSLSQKVESQTLAKFLRCLAHIWYGSISGLFSFLLKPFPGERFTFLPNIQNEC